MGLQTLQAGGDVRTGEFTGTAAVPSRARRLDELAGLGVSAVVLYRQHPSKELGQFYQDLSLSSIAFF